MNPPPLTYTCIECDAESPEWDDEPLGLCRYTGRPHGGDPGPCDCGASSDWTCDDCADPRCRDCDVILTDAIDQDCGICRSCGADEDAPWAAADFLLGEGINRAEAMGRGDRI